MNYLSLQNTIECFTFIIGIVDPPNTKVVKSTMMSVVVTITCRVSSLNCRWRDSA